MYLTLAPVRAFPQQLSQKDFCCSSSAAAFRLFPYVIMSQRGDSFVFSTLQHGTMIHFFFTRDAENIPTNTKILLPILGSDKSMTTDGAQQGEGWFDAQQQQPPLLHVDFPSRQTLFIALINKLMSITSALLEQLLTPPKSYSAAALECSEQSFTDGKPAFSI